ncbi:MAG: isoprenylcysteine carboxylmethyltransferase family protein [Candidatus Thioglobus sp.]|nr:MAG: isoprenylcysteine carboxylmethyltransferase family protein [Candidatus Thioglobus sp.]
MIYVVVQFSCIIYLIFNMRFDALDALEWVLILAAMVIGLSAIINMRLGNINILPTLKHNHQLVTSGIYRWIRHPMYSSVLLMCLALTLTNSHQIAQLVMIVLLLDLALKSNLEEKLLAQNFKEYSSYKSKTGRFIPFL